jgi:hypothetical protein
VCDAIKNPRPRLVRLGQQRHTATLLPSQEARGEKAHRAGQSEDGGESALAGPGGGETFGGEHEGGAHGADPGAEEPVFAAGVAKGSAPVSVRVLLDLKRGEGGVVLIDERRRVKGWGLGGGVAERG